jgi:hypothetical protein
MLGRDTESPRAALAILVEEVDRRLSAMTGSQRGAFVGSELPTVDRALARIQTECLASGSVFCEWGSGLGGVCGVAALNGFTTFGIEIRGELVDSARSLAEDLCLPMVFAKGTFLLPGDEDLAATSAVHTQESFDHGAWEEIGLEPEDCDVIFAYPWPGEEAVMDDVFARHAAPDALLLTFHDFDRVLAQRKVAHDDSLRIVGWL